LPVLEASRFHCYLENVVDENTPSADTIYRHIEKSDISSLRGMYKEIVDKTEWGYYGRNALRHLWVWGYKSKRETTGSFLSISFMIVVEICDTRKANKENKENYVYTFVSNIEMMPR